MKRTAQLWQLVDLAGDPLPAELPHEELHRLVQAAQDGEQDLTHVHEAGYESLLAAEGTSLSHFVLYRLRRNDLPGQLRPRARSGASVVPLSVEGLAEGTHLFFQPRNLVVVVPSGFSPRPARLTQWLAARTTVRGVALQPVYRADLERVLDDLDSVRSFEIRVTPEQARRFAEGDRDDALAVLAAAAGDARGGTITVRWSVGRDDDQGWLQRLVQSARRRGPAELPASRVRATVRGTHQGLVPVDFLEDQVVASVEVETTGRSKQFDAASALQQAQLAWERFCAVERVLDQVAVPAGVWDVPVALRPVVRVASRSVAGV